MKTKSIKDQNILKIFVDGASRGNPGPAAYAFIFLQNNNISFEKSEFLGTTTNNVAEYKGILNAFKKALIITEKNIKLYSDSQLAVRQLNKEYQIKANHLLKLANKIFQMIGNFKSVEIIHLPRNNKYIQICDKLCNELLDEEGY